MADYFPGAIQIGGSVSRAVATQLANAITEARVSLDWGGATFAPSTSDDLQAAVDAETKVLQLYDDQARYGAFWDLERWLEAHGVTFVRTSDARYEFDGEVVSFRPGVGLVTHTATQDGSPTVMLDKLLPVRELLLSALAERSPEKVRAALAALDAAIGPAVPTLSPLIITD